MENPLTSAVSKVAAIPVTVQDNVRPGPTNVAISDERLKREDANGFLDYAGAAYRQDLLFDGLAGWYAGQQMRDDPAYNVWADPEWAEVDKTVAPQYHSWLAEARSPAQFQYIKGRILQKQDDLEKLGDLGGWGMAGRFALGFVDPTNLASGYIGGLAYKGFHGYRMARAAAAVKATTGAGATRAAGDLVAEVSRAPSIAAGVASAAAQNVAFEKIRQSVNFEDSTAQLIEAGLMGAALSAPFIVAGTRAQRRVAATAAKEREALHLLADAQEGRALTPEQQTFVVDTLDQAGFIRKVEEGGIAPDEVINIDYDWMVRKGMIQPDEEIVLSGPATRPTVETAGRTEQSFVDDRPAPQVTTAGIELEELFDDGIDLAPPPARPLRVRDIEVTEGSMTPAEEAALLEPLSTPQAPSTPRGQEPEVDAPAGFLARGSIGSGAREGAESVADQRTWMSGKTVTLNGKEYFLPTRYDFFATLNRSDNSAVRRLAFDLIKDPIQVDKDYAQGFTASEWKSQIRRTLMGGFMQTAREARMEAARVRGKTMPFFGRESFAHEFNSLVTRLTRGERGVLDANPDIAPMLQKASAAQQKMYADFLAEMKAAGVKGADQLDPNAMYVNRIWKHSAIREVGIEKAAEIIARSVKDPELRGNVKEARKFLDVVMRLEYSPLLREIGVGASDMAYVRAKLEEAGITGADADSMIRTLLAHDPRSDTGRAPNLKYRWDLDEAAPDLDGRTLSDLTENDAFLLADIYANSMAGHIGLAKVGIRSSEDWAARVAEIEAAYKEKGGDPARLARDKKLLEDVYSHITGRPMSTADFSPAARIAGALRGYTRSTMLGQLGLLSAFELRHALALSSARAIWAHSPTFGQFIKALRSGYVPDNQLSRDVRAFAGFGNEISMSYMREAEAAEFGLEVGLMAVERGANRVSHAVDVVSGNRNITSLTRNIAAMAQVQKHVDWAAGRKTPNEGDITRMVGQGVNREDLDDLLANLREYAVVDGDGIVKQLDYERWKQERPESHDKYLQVLNRETRDAIQDHDLGETMPWMHTTIGKVLAELKTFFLVAHAKNFLKNLSYRDHRMMQVFIISYVGEMLAYSLQQAINYNHDPRKLEEKLQPEKVAMAAWGRASALGITSYLYGSAHKLAFGEDPFTGLTANTGNRTFLPPSVTTIQNLMSVPGVTADALTGRTITQDEARSALKTLPLSNTWGFRQGVDYISSMQPKTDPEAVGR